MLLYTLHFFFPSFSKKKKKKKKKTPRGRHYGGVRCKHEHVLLRSGTSTSAKVAVNSGRKK
jgi:hypothetical protein